MCWRPSPKASGVELGLLQNGLLTAIPYGVAMVVMILWSRHSDKRAERCFHTGIPAIIAALSITAGLLLNQPIATVIGFILLAAGVYSAIVVFWSIPSSMLTGVGSAVAIGLIDSIGNLSGFMGPYITGGLFEATGP